MSRQDARAVLDGYVGRNSGTYSAGCFHVAQCYLVIAPYVGFCIDHLERRVGVTFLSFGEQAPNLIERVGRVVQMNDTMAIGAQNRKVFHSCLPVVVHLGQW